MSVGKYVINFFISELFMQQPTVSIVTPVYKVKDYIADLCTISY